MKNKEEKTYKRVPFDVEQAKKIQLGLIKGKIVDGTGYSAEIIIFNGINTPLPIVVKFECTDDYTFFVGIDGFGMSTRLFIELPEEMPKYEFKPFDKVLVRNNDTEQRFPAIYTHMHNDVSGEFYTLIGNQYVTQYIPYAGNKHLVGTTKIK